MNIKLSLTHSEIVEAIRRYVSEQSKISIPADDIEIQVKSVQNYRSTWEPASVKAGVELRVGDVAT